MLFDRAGLKLTDSFPETNRTIGEELLEPTVIYVTFALAALAAGVPVKAFLHITGDSFFNLTRVAADVGYDIDDLLSVPPVFQLIQHHGDVPDEEMFRVFNMGVGFCVVAPAGSVGTLSKLAKDSGHQSKVIGCVKSDRERTIRIKPRQLEGKHGVFRRY